MQIRTIINTLCDLSNDERLREKDREALWRAMLAITVMALERDLSGEHDENFLFKVKQVTK